jgi:hypothetical protein
MTGTEITCDDRRSRQGAPFPSLSSHTFTAPEREMAELQVKLARCRALAKEFPNGPTDDPGYGRRNVPRDPRLGAIASWRRGAPGLRTPYVGLPLQVHPPENLFQSASDPSEPLMATVGPADRNCWNQPDPGGLVLRRMTKMAEKTTLEVDAGTQIPPRPHDSGSGANETVDGLDATTEALRQAVEDAPSVSQDDVDAVPVFDRADVAPRI